MRTFAWLALRALLLGLPLAWLWLAIGQDLARLGLVRAALPAAHALGLDAGGLAAVPIRLASYVPFLVLMSITPGIPPLRRCRGIALGSLAIFTFHLGFVLWMLPAAAGEANAARGGALSPVLAYALISDGLPLALWVLLARDALAPLASAFSVRNAAPEAPGSEQ